jgi:signal transduction histidine kinase
MRVAEVTDTGPGIAPESIQRLFVPFERLEADLARGVEGTVLGLPLSQRLAEAMGGTLEVTSAVGQGSTFVVELPMTKTPATVPSVWHIGPPPEQDQPDHTPTRSD